MTITLVGSSADGSVVLTGIPIATCPTGVQNGDVLIALCTSQGATSTAPAITSSPQGFTQIGSTQSFGASTAKGSAALFVRIASGESPGSTQYYAGWSNQSNNNTIVLLAYRGVANSSVNAVFDVPSVIANSGTTSSTTATYPAITAASNNSMLVRLGGAGDTSAVLTGPTWSTSTGHTELVDV